MPERQGRKAILCGAREGATRVETCAPKPQGKVEGEDVMYAIIRSGGKQYKVAPGDKVRMALSQAEVNSTVEFPEVLAVDEGAGLRVGTPLIESAKVTAKVLAHGRDRKIIVFRFKI